jgi:hypothetical protein
LNAAATSALPFAAQQPRASDASRSLMQMKTCRWNLAMGYGRPSTPLAMMSFWISLVPS